MIGGWSNQPSLPNKLALGAAVIVGNRIFYSGGFNNVETSNKGYSAPINPDGSLGDWIVTGEMPQVRFGHGMVEYGSYIYILGGYNGSYLSSVIKASVNPDGTMSSFTNVASIPNQLIVGIFENRKYIFP